MWRRSQVAKAEVCKTFIHRFNSDRRLQSTRKGDETFVVSSPFLRFLADDLRWGRGLLLPHMFQCLIQIVGEGLRGEHGQRADGFAVGVSDDRSLG